MSVGLVRKDHIFSRGLALFLDCCNASSKVHSTEIKRVGDKNDCSQLAFLLCTQNCEFPGVLSATPKTFDDVKMKRGKRSHNAVMSS